MKVVIILGSPLKPNNEPTELLKERLNKGAEIFKHIEDELKLIIVTGGCTYGTTVSQSTVMKRYLVDAGLPDWKIYEENNAQNTIQHCKYSLELINSLFDRRISYQEILSPNWRSNYSRHTQNGEAPFPDEIYVITSASNAERTKFTFNQLMPNKIKLNYIVS